MQDKVEQLLDEEMNEEDLVTRLARIRAVICPNQKYGDEVERCPCVRGGRDAGKDRGQGQTGCKDLKDAMNKIAEDPEKPTPPPNREVRQDQGADEYQDVS